MGQWLCQDPEGVIPNEASMRRSHVDLLTLGLTLGAIAVLAYVACGCASTRLRVEGPQGLCGAVLVAPDRIATVAHCAQAQATVSCAGEGAGEGSDETLVVRWAVQGDAALGVLARPLACDLPSSVGELVPGTAVWRGRVVQVEPGDIVNAEPRRFCRGSSGDPIYSTDGRVVALVSGGWGNCSYRAKVVRLAP